MLWLTTVGKDKAFGDAQPRAFPKASRPKYQGCVTAPNYSFVRHVTFDSYYSNGHFTASVTDCLVANYNNVTTTLLYGLHNSRGGVLFRDIGWHSFAAILPELLFSLSPALLVLKVLACVFRSQRCHQFDPSFLTVQAMSEPATDLNEIAM